MSGGAKHKCEKIIKYSKREPQQQQKNSIQCTRHVESSNKRKPVPLYLPPGCHIVLVSVHFMFCLYSIHTTLWGQGTLRTGYFEVGRLWEQDGWGERWRVANNRMPSSYSYLLIVCTVILSFIVVLYYWLLVNRCSK